MCLSCEYYPTNPFTTLVPHDQEIGEFYVVQERRVTDFSKIVKGFVGYLQLEHTVIVSSPYPTGLFKVLGPCYREIGEFPEVVQRILTLESWEGVGRVFFVSVQVDVIDEPQLWFSSFFCRNFLFAFSPFLASTFRGIQRPDKLSKDRGEPWNVFPAPRTKVLPFTRK